MGESVEKEERTEIKGLKMTAESLAQAVVIANREIVTGHFLMVLKVPSLFRESRPGQFVMMRLPGREIPFLGRPFSIHAVYSRGDDTLMEIIYHVVGGGTAVIAGLGGGESVTLTGPLGHGFDIPAGRKTVVIIAGGIGLAPLAFLAERRREASAEKDERLVCYAGFRDSDHIYGMERFEAACSEIKISTDDGSRGYHGPVTALFQDDIRSYGSDDTIVCACGPGAMLESLVRVVRRHAIPCQVSMEERMACGIGACLGCAVEAASKKKRYLRVCKEGPVFDVNDLAWRVRGNE